MMRRGRASIQRGFKNDDITNEVLFEAEALRRIIIYVTYLASLFAHCLLSTSAHSTYLANSPILATSSRARVGARLLALTRHAPDAPFLLPSSQLSIRFKVQFFIFHR